LLVTAVGYAALTAFAMAFRTQPLQAELRTLVQVSASVTGRYGHAHIPIWLAAVGYSSLVSWASVVALAALTTWLVRRRKSDIWLLLGVTGMAARMATYHGSYDDTMTLPALVALYRIAMQPRGDRAGDIVAGALFALLLVFLLAPVTMARMGWPWWIVHQVLQPMVWLAALIFLAREAGASRRRQPASVSR
jgi:hypothetical protein